MPVNITGMDEVLAKLASKLSPAKLSRVEGEALKVAGRLTAVQLKRAVASYKDTGATVQEITVSNPRTVGGVKTIKIGWSGSGSRQRWRLVHLNEFGYTRGGKTFSPRGMGKIQATYDAVKQPAKAIEAKELKKLL